MVRKARNVWIRRQKDTRDRGQWRHRYGNRWTSEDDIASAIVFLLGSSAAMITGVSLPIDGGFTTG
ncbi:SDR family oxidoreductase [Rhizobium viscosum]|uniref:SDR family oxidoreductase n=1 Tax=Rhizobium viscosum TaxID=1673 RepID=UPI0028AD8409|nr:SDR family oxidoreductase [Rhizobium viscosum]